MNTQTQSQWPGLLDRSAGGAPYVSPVFALQAGPGVHLVDIRPPDEAVGVLGHVPGSVFVPPDRLEELTRRADDLPIVLISAEGRLAAAAARELEERGAEKVAAMLGGLVAWRRLGFGTSRDRRGVRTELLPVSEVPIARTGNSRRILTMDDVRTHIGDPRTVRWIQLASLLFQAHSSCIDGRDARGIVGMPGGDAGEFVLGLAAVEQVGGLTLTESEIQTTLLAYVDTFGDYYMHSDEGALHALVAALRDDPVVGPATRSLSTDDEWEAFLRQPDPALRESLLAHLTEPAHVGCGHLKLMLLESDEYGARKAMVEGAIRAFYRMMWDGAPELRFVVLTGGHGEGAVVNIRLDEEPWGLAFIPVISPAFEGTQMFVNHPDVAAVLRGTAVEFHCRPLSPARIDRSRADALEAAMDALGKRQLAATAGALAKGLPVYEVVFSADRTFDVR